MSVTTTVTTLLDRPETTGHDDDDGDGGSDSDETSAQPEIPVAVESELPDALTESEVAGAVEKYVDHRTDADDSEQEADASLRSLVPLRLRVVGAAVVPVISSIVAVLVSVVSVLLAVGAAVGIAYGLYRLARFLGRYRSSDGDESAESFDTTVEGASDAEVDDAYVGVVDDRFRNTDDATAD